MKSRHTLLGLLAFSVATVWVRERWAVSALETGAFLILLFMLVQAALGRRCLRAAAVTIPVAFVCLWSAIQLGACWTVVRSDTFEAWLYWLTAACLVLVGRNACHEPGERERFLREALWAGSLVSFLGILQMFTSGGRIFWLFASGYEAQVIGPFVNPNNYAAFVELLVPVGLWLAFEYPARARAYLAVAAALGASVVASGSRAGTIVVALECVAAFLLRLRRGPSKSALTFVILAAAFTGLVGYQFLWDRFASDSDPYLLRREFLQSSVAMFSQQPWHGFGMGNWPAVYPQFALVDSGTVANHAHNEWAQWAAEGGLPVLLMMTGVLAWCSVAALRSTWGLGILAVLIHSCVDYPFMRLGLAAWIFAFIGVLSTSRAHNEGRRRLRARLFAAAAIPVLAVGIFAAGKLAYADSLFRQATPESRARAAAIRPDKAEYQAAIGHFSRALELNPQLTRVRIALAAEQEVRGDIAGAQATLLEAARRDRQYLPAWAMTNFCFRNRPQQFWPWARSAARMAYGDMSPLFDLCLLASDHAEEVFDRVVAGRRFAEREYLAYLTRHSRLRDAHLAARSLAGSAGPADREVLLNYVDGALAGTEATGALDIWNALCGRRLVPYQPSTLTTLVNEDFARPISSRGFDWIERPATGVMLFQSGENGPGLEVALSGNQPERCEILAHFVAVDSPGVYVLRFQYRTADLPRESGLIWSAGREQEFAISATGDWTEGNWRFLTSNPAVRLVLAYRRARGTTRKEGKLFLRRVELKEDASL